MEYIAGNEIILPTSDAENHEWLSLDSIALLLYHLGSFERTTVLESTEVGPYHILRIVT
jgi:hypothetical protein